MQLIIFELIDIAEDIINTTKEVSYNSQSIGEILRKRTYELNDGQGKYNPELTTSYFGSNDWRGRSIVEYNDQGALVFEGEISNIKGINRGKNIATFVEAVEPLRILLDYPIEENTKNETYRVNEIHSKGNDIVQIDTGTTELTTGSLVAFTASLVPRYEIKEAQPIGGATKTITLDRALEKLLANNDVVYNTIATEKTIPEALKDALLILIDPSRLLSGFDSFDTIESTANRKIYMNIRIENSQTLRAHIAKLLELSSNLYQIITDNDGLIDLKWIPYQGEGLRYTISENEFIPPIELFDDMTRVLEGYDLLYRAGDEVFIESDSVDIYTQLAYNSIKRFQSIQGQSIHVSDYMYLYNSQTTAAHYGDEALNYFKTPKKIVKANIKRTISDDLSAVLNLQRGSTFKLTVKQSDLAVYTNEPVYTYASVYDEKNNKWVNVTFELNN